MKKKSFNEISGTMSKAEMKGVVGGANICSTKCYPTTSSPVGSQPAFCIYPSQYNVNCFCIYPPGSSYNYDQIFR